MTEKWTPAIFKDFHKQEHDACGIVACLEKHKIPTRKNIFDCIDALVTMNHRAGFINGEGDGVGIHIDIPVALWKEKLLQADLDPSLVEKEQFAVGHVFVSQKTDWKTTKQELITKLKNHGLELIFETDQVTDPDALGPIAIQENPVFWQFACLSYKKGQELTKVLFETLIDFEENEHVHVASLSQNHVVYKVMGAGDILPRYYKDLANPLVASTMTLGHNRYSTNTLSNFFRVQPFSVLGHNGEINTIAKLRDEAKMIGVPLVKDGSDSQDLSRTMETFICRDGYTLFEVMDLLFPPIVNEIKAYPEHLQDLYTYLREGWGHFAQGPAGIVSRYADEAVFSVDALGLRPLWMLETETSYLFSSEPGIIPTTEYVNDPKPLAPGEKVGFKWNGQVLDVYEHNEYQNEVYRRFSKRLNLSGSRLRLTPPSLEKTVTMQYPDKLHNGQYKAFGWERDHIQLIEQMAEKGVEPIRSLGHDAPLAALNPERVNIADYIKESVAVVTNPAIDRERETEHFSTRVIIGKRPDLFTNKDAETVIELTTPLLIEGKAGYNCSITLQQPSFDQVVQFFQIRKLTTYLSMTFSKDETLNEALDRLANEAVEAVQSGKSLLILDDSKAHQEEAYWIDPHLVTSAIDQALVKAELRRDCSLLVRSAAIRSLHDIITVFGLGADLISPYYMFLTVLGETEKPLINLYSALTKGLEKVISTIGIHELRGYGRLFSSIGLHEEVAKVLNIINFFGSDQIETDFEAMKQDALKRAEDFHNEKERIGKTFHLFPRIWKSISELASTGDYGVYRDKITEQETMNPTTIRHLIGLKQSEKPLSPEEVDIRVGEHDLPFVISSMSFGSQNEIAFRAYAEGADRLNMVSLNGEGGEIKDMLGKYPRTRGQQVASGRFGVNAELLNSSNLLEIKIGQGAKPGEGGHLPGSKVTAKVAAARNATLGSDLISPSNNHDIYSIEDLAQMILELKTANDQAKIAVKVPVVPNIGTIAVGIAKAGADIITLSGFDGGTGAARIHALQHVGLPVEIGVKAAHNALLESGLRHKVELWADGGIKSAMDVMKIMLLGANRVGFGTLAMLSIGCTTCRGCHLDTCHVGIATQIESEAQAKEHGLRRFVPRQFDKAVQGIVNLFGAFGQELKAIAASMGIKNLQDAVGRSDLLEQVKGEGQLNLSYLLKPLFISQFAKMEDSKSTLEVLMQVACGAEYLDASVDQLQSSREFVSVTSNQRVLGSRVSCHRVRGRLDGSYRQLPPVQLKYKEGSIPGNGLGAYNSDGIEITVNGGGQDGVGKTSYGGSIHVLKAKGKNGKYVNGSVGKGFGYGAQRGLLVAQGNADARAGIRLSGADMIIGGQLVKPIPENENGNIGSNANIKGFAFEYMTNGRGLVLGDPGPWICAGMTGGVVYIRQQPEMGLTKKAIERRIAKGAKVSIEELNEKGKQDVLELLTKYANLLESNGQAEEAEQLQCLIQAPEKHFVQIVPVKEQADPSVSTE
ncbi:glutamate synthase-related protein [Neobacillus thermocopriae]|uniref:glutamate synthase-related protein n=1 Tax=Neobacillus thermocopriae TaxID=1215031 RepID=UPI002E1F97C4|nr:glutamate synthase-related protein [Neobacillus thermocopriae]MED3623742.1 glutamate synthase-related protein [Neobacillus thermocopriae]MED3713049.1 glutamate synthase-related protein [Neobacillus thermocopriae]